MIGSSAFRGWTSAVRMRAVVGEERRPHTAQVVLEEDIGMQVGAVVLLPAQMPFVLLFLILLLAKLDSSFKRFYKSKTHDLYQSRYNSTYV